MNTEFLDWLEKADIEDLAKGYAVVALLHSALQKIAMNFLFVSGSESKMKKIVDMRKKVEKIDALISGAIAIRKKEPLDQALLKNYGLVECLQKAYAQTGKMKKYLDIELADIIEDLDDFYMWVDWIE